VCVLQTLQPCRASLPHTTLARSLARSLSLARAGGGAGLDGVVRKRKGVKKGKPAAKRGRGGRMGGIVLEDDDDDDAGAKDGVCACMHVCVHAHDHVVPLCTPFAREHCTTK
jgi:hypothetical protein